MAEDLSDRDAFAPRRHGQGGRHALYLGVIGPFAWPGLTAPIWSPDDRCEHTLIVLMITLHNIWIGIFIIRYGMG